MGACVELARRVNGVQEVLSHLLLPPSTGGGAGGSGKAQGLGAHWQVPVLGEQREREENGWLGVEAGRWTATEQLG